MNRLIDVALVFWFILTAVAYWAPYLSIGLPPNTLTALYAAFLIVAVLRLALNVLRHRS
jgi:hypothetical protein